MNIKRIYAIFLRQVYLSRDNASRFISMFTWITLDIILWGFISKYVGGIVAEGTSFVLILLGAVLLWDFLTQVMQGLTMAFFEDIWSRNFLNIFASPLRISEYVAGLVLSGIARGILTLVVMLILASLFFGLSVFIYGTYLALFLMILFLFGIALGIIGVAIVFRLGPSAEWFIWPIPALLSPFVGVFYPVAILPQWMQYVSYAFPPSYVFDSVRAVISGGQFSAQALFFGIALSLVYIVGAYFVFLAVYKKAVRTGLVARYSAENLS